MSDEMSGRQRHREALLFGKPDRIPLTPGGGRRPTLARWHKEGLGEQYGAGDAPEQAYRQAGGRLPWPKDYAGFKAVHRMIPMFEEKVIERKGESHIVQDWKGNICEVSAKYPPEDLRTASDFITRRWIKCPVENDADWQEMKKRYNPDLPERYPENAAELGRTLNDGGAFVQIGFHGPFWQLREWCGFENLCMFFYDQPKLVAEMLEFWRQHVARMLDNVFKYTTPDSIHISEDMAYKSFSMISPRMVRQHLLPIYRHWGDRMRKAGVPIYAVDSDGFIGELIPIWIEAGVNVCDPIEVAAGNDIVKFRREFGRSMAYRGGIDKRAIAKGGAVIEEELRRVDPVIRSGGYIPGCDHGVPHDISWPNYVRYTGLLAKATGWM